MLIFLRVLSSNCVGLERGFRIRHVVVTPIPDALCAGYLLETTFKFLRPGFLYFDLLDGDGVYVRASNAPLSLRFLRLISAKPLRYLGGWNVDFSGGLLVVGGGPGVVVMAGGLLARPSGLQCWHGWR